MFSHMDGKVEQKDNAQSNQQKKRKKENHFFKEANICVNIFF
jgi:hypothetical protein